MVQIPATPSPGLVLRYAYLWADEHDAGHEEGLKDRPVALMLATRQADDKLTAVVLPITHTPPLVDRDAMEIPAETKGRLGLDQARSWVVLTEVNVFAWPGPDLRSVTGSVDGPVTYGYLPRGFFRVIRDRFVAKHGGRAIRFVTRTE